WLIDLQSEISTRLTSDPAQDTDALWSPDGNEIVFASNRGGDWGLYRKSVRGTGSEELLLKTGGLPILTDWTHDGNFIIYADDMDIFGIPLNTKDRKPFPIVATPFVEYGGKTSPDGKWIAYASNETGQYEVYVQAFPGPGDR